MDIIQSTPVRSTNSPELTPPPPSPPYVEYTSPSVQTGQSTQTNQLHSLIRGLQPPAPRGVAARGGQKTKMKSGELLSNTHKIAQDY